MTSVIWKFPFDVEDEFSMAVPAGARFLKVDVQRSQPVMWFEVHLFDSTHPAEFEYEQRKFKVIGTGHHFEVGRLDYRGTFMLANDNFVGHLYEVIQ